MPRGWERRELHTGRRARLRRRSNTRIAVIALFALLLLAVIVGLARRQPPAERIVMRAEAPKVVTVPVLMPMPAPPPPPAPEPPLAPPPEPPPHRIATVPARAEQPRAVQPRAEQPAERAPQVPQPMRTPTATELAAQYRDVGQALRGLADSSTTDALWTHYRRIRLADCLIAEDKRAGCAQMLDAIASDARRQ